METTVQDGHPVRVGGEALHHLEDFGGQGGVFGDLGMKGVKFGLIGQAAVPKQINDFFIKGVGSEVLDAVADVSQLPSLPLTRLVLLSATLILRRPCDEAGAAVVGVVISKLL